MRSHGFWSSSILPILLLVARLFPCLLYARQSSFYGARVSLGEILVDLSRYVCKEMDFLSMIQQWPRPSEMFWTPRLTIGLDSWLMTLCFLLLIGNSRRMRSTSATNISRFCQYFHLSPEWAPSYIFGLECWPGITAAWDTIVRLWDWNKIGSVTFLCVSASGVGQR